MAALPALTVSWDESAQALDTFLRYNGYRRIAGDADWVRIFTITDRSLTSYADYSVGSAITYEYAVTVVAEVGGEEVEGDFPTAVSSTIQVHSVFIHSFLHPEVYVELQAHTQDVGVEQDIAYAQVWGRTARTAHFGPREEDVVSVGWSDAWFQGDEHWEAVRELLTRQRAGDTLVMRQHRGVRLFGVLEAPGRGDAPVMYNGSLRFRATHFTEVV